MALTSEMFDRINQGLEGVKQKKQQQFDNIYKRAAMRESGYDVQGDQLVEIPDFQGTKQLERQLKQIELQTKQRQLASFNEPIPTDPRTGQPLFYNIGGELRNNPSLPARYQLVDPKLEEQKYAARARGQTAGAMSVLGEGNQFSANGNLPPGTMLKAGALTIPMNPKLTGDEQSAISSYEAFKPQADEIIEQVKAGALDSPIGDVGRTINQFRAQSASGMLTAGDKKLSPLQSNINSIRRYAFGEGGKNLTGTEKQIIDSLLNLTGKSNQRIESDYRKALAILEKKNALITGGMNAVGTQSAIADKGKGKLPTFASEAEIPAGFKGRAIVNGEEGTVN